VHDALAAAGVQPASSQFDLVFRSGVDHLANGHAHGSAVTSFQEALTYYDSALAAQYRDEAEAAGDTDETDAMPAAPTKDDGGVFGGAVIWIALGGLVLLAAVFALAFFLRRRRAGGRRTSAASGPISPAPTTDAPGPELVHVSAAHGAPRAGEPLPGPVRTPSGDDGGRDRTRLRQSPAMAPAGVPALLAETRPASIPAPAYCSNCGGALRHGGRFCGSCGSPVA
jgi:hypothetical protein